MVLKKQKPSLPEFIYVARTRGVISKINPAKGTAAPVFKSTEPIMWVPSPMNYLPDDKLILEEQYSSVVVDLKSKKIINKKDIRQPLYFPKHRVFAYIKQYHREPYKWGVYLNKNLDDLSNDVKIADNFYGGIFFLLKMTEDEFGFWGFDENEKEIFTVYNLNTQNISVNPVLKYGQTHRIYRSRTGEFFIDKKIEDNWFLFSIDNKGTLKPGPKCISDLSPFNALLYYDEKLDQIYFLSTYVRFLPKPAEDHDLYVYDCETDQCVKLYESIYVGSMITSSEIEAIDEMVKKQ